MYNEKVSTLGRLRRDVEYGQVAALAAVDQWEKQTWRLGHYVVSKGRRQSKLVMNIEISNESYFCDR